jgi:hypothetical protein
LRVPKLFELRADPFERGDESMLYDKWMVDRAFVAVPAQAFVVQWLNSFKEFPVRQKPAAFNLDAVMATLSPGLIRHPERARRAEGVRLWHNADMLGGKFGVLHLGRKPPGVMKRCGTTENIGPAARAAHQQGCSCMSAEH